MDLKLGFDLDGVLADGIREIWKEAKKRGYIPEDHSFEEVRYRIEDQYGIPMDVVYDIFCCELYERCPPLIEAVEDVRRWRDEGHYIVFITARSEEFTPGVTGVTREWLEEHDLLRGTAGIVHCPTADKHLVAAEHDLDVFVDDDHRAIRPMVDVIDHPFLIRTSYNEDADDLGRWNWGDVSQEIDCLIIHRDDSTDTSEDDRGSPEI